MSATQTNALLPVENGAGRRNSRDQHQQQHKWQPKRQRNKSAGKIEERFPARHLWLGYHRDASPDVNKASQRGHGQAAALGHPPAIGKVSSYRCFVEFLQAADARVIAAGTSERGPPAFSSLFQGNVIVE